MKYRTKLTYIFPGVVFLTSVAVGRSFFEMIVHCKRSIELEQKRRIHFSRRNQNHPRYQFKETYEEGKAWCRQQKMKDWYVRSADGLLLHASYLPAEDAKRTVLLSHGYRGSGFGDFANMARFLHEHNCNLLFIDQRCCGRSEGEYITFGAREQDDICRWSYLIAIRNHKEKLPIYLYGESMGAAAVLMASGKKLPGEVKGLIADCGFQSMKGQIRDLANKWLHLPRTELLLLRLSVRCRFLGDFRMGESDTTQAMAQNRRPVLFFHGADDTYVYPKNSVENYKLCRAPKELVIIPGARHLCSAYVAPGLYRKKIMEFFKRYD